MKNHRFPVVCIVGGGPVGLVASGLLKRFGVPHSIIERRQYPTTHPQAHFLNARSMEILQAYFPNLFIQALNSMPQSINWRDFVYCHTLTDTESQFNRQDHFESTKHIEQFWSASPSNVVHLAQNKLEALMRNDSPSIDLTTFYKGYQVMDVVCEPSISSEHMNAASPIRVAIKGPDHKDIRWLTCDYLLAADGANSFVRNALCISLEGQSNMQTLLNVHFSCPGLRSLLNPRPAMLYFVFNEHAVAVFVSHDVSKDEWVCQIPYFPPYQTQEDFDIPTLTEILTKLLFPPTAEGAKVASKLPLHIHSVNSWTMHAEVAASFSNPAGNVFLVGDAAHRFPPAGGFGLNTGIQDAHNLAWKIAAVYHKQASRNLLSDTYEAERKAVATANSGLSIRNYAKSAAAARALGVDPQLARLVLDTARNISSVGTCPMQGNRWGSGLDIAAKSFVRASLSMGLTTLQWLRDWKSNPILGALRVRLLQQLVSSGRSLPLIFPDEDLGFRYTSGALVKALENRDPSATRNKNSERQLLCDELVVGGRVPHCWLEVMAPPLPLDRNAVRKRTVVSTVHLPVAIEQLIGRNMCTVLLVVYGDSASPAVHELLQSAEKMNEKLNFDAFTVVAVSPPMEKVSHEEVQKLCQQPRYAVGRLITPDLINGPPESCSFELLPHSKVLGDRQTIGDSSVGNADVAKSPTWVQLRDITGRWNEVLTARDDSAENIIAAIRPDGHICAVFQGTSMKNGSIFAFLNGIATALYLNKKG